jgi:hypothetical protein
MKKNIFLVLVAFGFMLQSCSDGNQSINITASNTAQIDTSEGSCPYLTKDEKGNIILSWIKKTSDSNLVFSYAVSKDEGKTFGKTVEIPGSNNIHPHGENLPKIVFGKNGEIVAAWGSANPNPKNAYSDLVYYAQSFDNGTTWTTAQKLVKDTAGYDQRYFDMALLKNGNIAICWLDNRKKTKGEGSGLFFAEATGNLGFENEHFVTGPCCPCCRTDLYVDSKSKIHVLYRGIINDSIRDMEHAISSDNGKTFSMPERISDDNWVINGCPHTGPAMTENKDGIQFTWFTGGNNAGVYYCYSGNEGKTFSEREQISGMASRHCQIASVNNAIAIVWNENFSNGNLSCSRIGIEVRNEKGNDRVKKFITSEKGEASFPVIKAVNKNAALVAYTENIKGKDFVMYKRVEL